MFYKFINFVQSFYYSSKSLIIIFYLKSIGAKVDFTFFCKNFPYLDLSGEVKNLEIKKNVKFLGTVDLRNRENGKLIFNNNVKIEGDTRFVSAREGTIEIKDNSIIAKGTVINGGGNVIIGKNCIIGPHNIINANDHKIDKKLKIINREFLLGDVIIEEDSWTGAFVSIKKNVTISEGSVIGAHSFVTSNTLKNSINYGIPARHIKYRD